MVAAGGAELPAELLNDQSSAGDRLVVAGCVELTSGLWMVCERALGSAGKSGPDRAAAVWLGPAVVIVVPLVACCCGVRSGGAAVPIVVQPLLVGVAGAAENALELVAPGEVGGSVQPGAAAAPLMGAGVADEFGHGGGAVPPRGGLVTAGVEVVTHGFDDFAVLVGAPNAC